MVVEDGKMRNALVQHLGSGRATAACAAVRRPSSTPAAALQRCMQTLCNPPCATSACAAHLLVWIVGVVGQQEDEEGQHEFRHLLQMGRKRRRAEGEGRLG